MPISTESGESSKLCTADPEYPCVRRLRHRRLLTFLWQQGYEDALGSMAADTDACFSVSHLRRFVERGQWKYAVEYLLRFLPPDLDSLGLEAQVLRRFLVAHMAIANILDNTKDGDILAASYTKYRNHGSSVRHGAIRLRSIMLTALHGKEQLRASLDWERVRLTASEIVDDLAYRTPELKHLVLKPGGPVKPHNVLPLGFSNRRRCPHKKQSRIPQASSVAKGYIRKRSSLLSSSCYQKPCDAMLNKAMSMVADAVDKSLKAGMRPKLNQKDPLQPKGPAKNPEVPSVLNASKLSSRVPMLSGPFSGSMFIAPVSPNVFGILPSHRKNSGSSLATNAGGAPVAPVSQSMNLTSHAPMSGAVAPIATSFGTFPGTANITGMPSMTNADNLTKHVLSSAVPFSRMMFGAPVLQTMSGSLITPAQTSRAFSISNPGATVAPVTQSMSSTNTMAGPADLRMPLVTNAGATVAPVTQSMSGTITMAGPADLRMPLVTNAGATVAPVTQAMFGTNTMASPDRDPRMLSVANAGSTVAPVTQALFGAMAGSASDPRIPSVANTENLHQSNSARKNTKEDLNSDGQDLHPKWQCTTGAFTEADMVEYLEGPDWN